MNDPTGPMDDMSARNAALLHEVDHRVKNNLQLIASLLVLQSRRESDPAVRAALATILNRVNAVAVVHRRLFQDNPLLFDVAAFLRDLSDDRSNNRAPIVVRIDVGKAQVPTAWAAPLALIVNELLSNSLAHGYPEGRAGTVTVSLARVDGLLRIGIDDDGVGAPEEFVDGFGLTIVRLLCRQLKADFEMRTDQTGVHAQITLPEPIR